MLVNIFISLATAVFALLCSYKMFQIFQLSSYRLKSVVKWFKVTGYDYLIRYFSLSFLTLIGMFVFVTCFSSYNNVIYLGLVFLIGFSTVFAVVTIKEQKKTPLKITPRIVRTAVLFSVLSGFIAFGLIVLGELWILSYSLLALTLMLIPFVCALSFVILSPLERLINSLFLRKAKAKLDGIDKLVRVGITGSFGKTSAKNILTAMLERKFRVASSPLSYNTPMGLCRYINEKMPQDSQIFVAEMGARYVGDIKELCDFICPDFALITSVGNQHIDTFGSLDNVKKTKYELIESLKNDGVAVFNGESQEVRSMFDKCTVKKYLAGDENADAYYSNLVVSGEGTSFDMHISNTCVQIKTKLLGKHVAGLICACALLSVALGASLDDIKAACESLKPIEHRLSLINNGDTVVLDDAYNSNYEGAKNALEVLSGLDGVKIIITPGFVELGQQEMELNSALGGLIAQSQVDFAYLIGSRAFDIKAGALKDGMTEEKLIVFDSLNSAVERLREVEGKKAVLFENDLPDNYL